MEAKGRVIEEQRRLIEEQRQVIGRLLYEIEALTLKLAKVNKDYSTSSKPPSCDIGKPPTCKGVKLLHFITGEAVNGYSKGERRKWISRGKGGRHLLCEAPEGPSRQKVPATFSPRR